MRNPATPKEVAEEDGEVVLVDPAGTEIRDARPVDVMADEPAEVVAENSEHDGGQRVEADQAAPKRWANLDGDSAHDAPLTQPARFCGSGR